MLSRVKMDHVPNRNEEQERAPRITRIPSPRNPSGFSLHREADRGTGTLAVVNERESAVQFTEYSAHNFFFPKRVGSNQTGYKTERFLTRFTEYSVHWIWLVWSLKLKIKLITSNNCTKLDRHTPYQ